MADVTRFSPRDFPLRNDALKMPVSAVRLRLCPLSIALSVAASDTQPMQNSGVPDVARPPQPWYWEARKGWYVNLRGKRILLARGKDAGEEARREFYRLMAAEGRAPAGTAGVGGDRLFVRDVFNLFLAEFARDVERGVRAEETLRRSYGRHLASAVERFGGLRVGEVRPLHVRRWVDSQARWGPTTRCDAVKAVKRAFNWAKRAGYIPANPVADLDRDRPRRREAIPTTGQVAAILAAIGADPFADLLRALIMTGCRPGEVADLTAGAADPDAGTWTVKNKTRSRTGEPTRTVHLTPETVALTRRLLAAHPTGHLFRNTAGRPWTRNAMACRFARLRKKLGLGREATAYAFRHYYVTTALVNGVPVATLAELVGHKDVTMIMKVYSHLAGRADHLRAAARQAQAGGPGFSPDPNPDR
jgi:integrase